MHCNSKVNYIYRSIHADYYSQVPPAGQYHLASDGWQEGVYEKKMPLFHVIKPKIQFGTSTGSALCLLHLRCPLIGRRNGRIWESAAPFWTRIHMGTYVAVLETWGNIEEPIILLGSLPLKWWDFKGKPPLLRDIHLGNRATMSTSLSSTKIVRNLQVGKG